jgi:hypothetical protein
LPFAVSQFLSFSALSAFSALKAVPFAVSALKAVPFSGEEAERGKIRKNLPP